MASITKYTAAICHADGTIIEMQEGGFLAYRATSASAKKFKGMKVPVQGSLSGTCLRENRVLICEDTEFDPRVDRDACRRTRIRSMIVVPLRRDGKMVGVLKAFAYEPHRFDDGQGQLLQLISGLLTTSFAQAEEFQAKQGLITALQKAEIELVQARDQAMDSTRSKSEFLANMSHEVRTPLNGILGITGILLDSGLNPEQTAHARAIESSGQALLTIVNDILDFSKIEAGKMDLEQVDFDITSTLLDIRRTFHPLAKNKGLELHLEVTPGIPTYVKGDPGRLRQILINLVSNAIKFTAQGEITIRASRIALGDESEFRFEVVDSGIGISPEAAKKLFQAFAQADSSTTRRFGGTGLGLSISKRLAEAMRGRIGVESQEGQGSKFWFTVRLQPGVQAEKLLTQKIEDPIGHRNDRQYRVLVAEDNQVNQMIAMKMLEKLGFRADVVGNGKEALSALSERPYDLILMDCQMPEMDGYEATAKIRLGQGGSDPRIPIIAMTANAMKGDERRCRDAGMDDYVSKPVSATKLTQILKTWVETIESRDSGKKAA